MLLRLFCKPYNLKKLVKIENDNDTFLALVPIASNAFSIPEGAVVISVANQQVDLNAAINSLCQNGSIVTIDTDMQNLSQKEKDLQEQKLNKAIQNNSSVQQMFNFLAQNSSQKLIGAYILASQEKLHIAYKIIDFTKKLKQNNFNLEDLSENIVNADQANQEVQNAENELQNEQKFQQVYPNTYLNFNHNTEDQYIQMTEQIKQAKLDLSNAQGLPIQLLSTDQLKPTKLRENDKDDETYELDQLKDKNINTVLIENLFVEIAVMYQFTSLITKQFQERQMKFNTWQEQDRAEDIIALNKDSRIALLMLLDIKDMLLGQYRIKQQKLDEQSAKKGFRAYLERLEKVYSQEIQQVDALMEGTQYDKAEALQALEQFNGNVNQTIDFLTK